MPNIFQFKPKANIDAERNVKEFIRRCRDDLTVFSSTLDWKSNSWKGVVNFTKAGAPSRGYTAEQILDNDILDFAKAYVRYQQGHKPSKLKNEIKAIRCIEPALLSVKGKADITLVDIAVLDEAIVVARASFKSTAYQAGIQLNILVKFLSDNHMITSPVIWKSPLSKPKEISRTSSSEKKRREEKIPPDHALEAMAEMFANDLQEPLDKYVTATFALTMCAPGRIMEFHDLPVNCLHKEKDRNGMERLGFRFDAGKGYGAEIKWISSPFVEIAEQAVQRLKELTDNARQLAKWLEEKPEQFYRHSNCPNVNEDTPLTLLQACDALGIVIPNRKAGEANSKLKQFFKSYTPYAQSDPSRSFLTLRFLNEYVHSQLPEGWPWKNKERQIKWSNSLFCMNFHELNIQKNTSLIKLWTPGKSTFTTQLNTASGWKSDNTIWKRHGYKNPDGTPLEMGSHQVRHLLNTAAQRGELGQLDIAKWSGRANITQNNTYNHMSEYEILDKVKGMKELQVLSGPLGKVKSHTPVTLEDLNAIGEGIAHVTEFGFCVHDYSMVPCQKHRDCLNCTEQVCIKGDHEKLERLKQQRKAINDQLIKAKTANDDGYSGADRWRAHQQKTLDRTDQLIEILQSSKVADGAVIRLRNDLEFSPLKRELEARQSNPKIKSKGPDKNEMRALLGGGLG